MIRTFSLAALLCSMTAALLAQTPRWELGTRAGAVYTFAGGDELLLGAPGGGPLGASTLHVGLFPSHDIILRPEVGFALSSDGIDRTDLVLAVSVEYHVGGVRASSPYLALLTAFDWSHIDGAGVDASDTDLSAGLGLGYRYLPYRFLAFTLQLDYRYWLQAAASEAGASAGVAVVVN